MIKIKNNYIFNGIFFFAVILLQIYWPSINLGKIQIEADIILLYITVIALLYGRFPAIIVGFLGGLFQDFSTQSDLLGIFSLSKSITAYFLGTIFSYKSIWSMNVRYVVILSSYILHFLIYFYLFSRNIWDFYYLSIFIFINSIIVFALLIILNNLIYKNKLI